MSAQSLSKIGIILKKTVAVTYYTKLVIEGRRTDAYKMQFLDILFLLEMQEKINLFNNLEINPYKKTLIY